MNKMIGFACINVALMLAACGSHPPAPDAVASIRSEMPLMRVSDDALGGTILLVSLEDGSVIMQTIQTSADICFKQNSSSSTTCLTQGDPVIDPRTSSIIGFEMIEERIQLVGKSD